MTFNEKTSLYMLNSVADAIDENITKARPHWDVHTISLVLNGQHGEFDLSVQATNQDMEDCEMTGRVGRWGGVGHLEFREQE